VAPAVPALRPLGVPERAVHGKSVLRGSQFPRNWRADGRVASGLRLAGGSDRAPGLSVVQRSKDVVIANVPPSRGDYVLVNSRSRNPVSRDEWMDLDWGEDATRDGSHDWFLLLIDRPSSPNRLRVRLFVAKVIDVHAWRRSFLSCTGVRVLKARARACEHQPAPPGKAVLGRGMIIIIVALLG
jgi:hypothetical protein